MNPLQAMLLGLVQGLTEFLPVSSSGHLLLFRRLFGLGDMSPAFDVMLHLGTLAAVIVVLRKDVAETVKSPKKILLLGLATIPAVAAGLLFGGFIEDVFYSGNYLWGTFLVTAALLLICEIIEFFRAQKNKPLHPVGIENAAAMGMMQAVALLPGLSRSGCTIFGGVVSGAERRQTATFSFLMSVPVIIGSAILSFGTIDVGWLPLLVGTASAFVGGMFAVKLMLCVIGSANYKWFSLYLLALSVVSIFIL